MSPLRKWLLGLASLFSVLAVVGCGSDWTGNGRVVDKDYHEAGMRANGYTSENTWHEECYELTIRDSSSGRPVKTCVDEQVWSDTIVGNQITITEEYKG